MKRREAKHEKILKDAAITHCYIRKGSYYRPNWCGYTDFQHRAGVYTKEEAVNHANKCNEITVVPINAKEHNDLLNAEIQDIQSRLLA